MALRVPNGKTNKQSLATATGSHAAFARRPILVGALLTAVLLSMLAVKSLSSGAVTVSTPAIATPALPVIATPALIHVPARNRLVLVDAVLANSLARARASTGSGHVTASRAHVRTFGNGRARLSFILSAGETTAKIRTLTVRLPSGIAFSHSHKRLEAGIVVKTSGKRLTLAASISHGKLTIRLTTPASRLHVRIASPAISVSKALAHKVKTREIKTLYTPITTTNTSHYTTRLTLKQRTR